MIQSCQADLEVLALGVLADGDEEFLEGVVAGVVMSVS